HVLDADRLAGAGRAEDHRDLPVGDLHVQPAQDLVAAERLVDVDELDRGGRAGGALLSGVPLIFVGLFAHRHPPMGARGFAPQKICVPSIPIRCTSTMFSTIDFAVAVPTPTGPPDAVYP